MLPPKPLFPDAIDTDYTLFLVYNTTETKLYKENSPWSREIDVIPTEGNEIWANNGFGNINGELFYYDTVERDETTGKVNKLTNCLRQLGGSKTRFNNRGTWVRSYVVAEHHNQLVDCIVNMETFIGYNYTPLQPTLDWRIRNLQALEIVFDDFNCPDVVFEFNTVSTSPTSGTVVNYNITFTLPGSTYDFSLDFGDGTITTTEVSGQHTYAANANISPVLTVTSGNCQIVQSPTTVPIKPVVPTFNIPIPEPIPFQDFTIVPCEVPEPDINLPPLVMPCGISVSPTITGPDINMVPQVTITGPDNPINITTPTVTVTGIPTTIDINPPIPPTIIVDPPIPPTIIIVPPESTITLDFDVGNLPRLEVDWGAPPEMQVAFTMSRPVRSPERLIADPHIVSEFGEEFADLFDASNKMKIEYEPVGLPEEIKILPPSSFPDVRLDSSSLEKLIVEIKELIPTNIKIFGPDTPIPTHISFDGPNIPDHITVHHDIPHDIVVRSTIAEEIFLRGAENIPREIEVKTLTPIPGVITVEHDIPSTIMVDGCPRTIEVIGFPTGIPLLPPDSLPPVEMVYRGGPIEFKINMEEVMTKNTDRSNCVMITPCV